MGKGAYDDHGLKSVVGLFSNAFEAIPTEVSHNKNKRYSGAEFKISGPVGHVVKSVDQRGKRYIHIQTRFGCVTIKENYDGDKNLYEVKASSQVETLFNAHFEDGGLRRPITNTVMLCLVGSDVLTENIGMSIETIYALMR